MQPNDEAGKPTNKILDRFIGLNAKIRLSDMKPVTSLAAVAFYFGGMIVLLLVPLEAVMDLAAGLIHSLLDEYLPQAVSV